MKGPLFALLLPLMLAAQTLPAAAVDLSNDACQKCHATGEAAITVPDGKKKRSLPAIPPSDYQKSVHGHLTCVSCHTDIVDAKEKHTRTSVRKVECGQCHINLRDRARNENSSKLDALQKVVDNVDAYRRSFHVREDQDRPGRPKANCEECHDSHTFAIPARKSPEYKAWRQTIPDLCGKCHEDHLEEWSTSAHGIEAQKKSEGKAAVCTDCHTTHEIINTSLDTYKLLYVNECGDCHEAKISSYRDTYHGQVHQLGYTYTAKCSDCHGSHGALKAADPASKIHPDNKLKTCKKCHDGKKASLASDGFTSFAPHANAFDHAKYPQVWWVARLMVALLITVFAFFWGHSILWWLREYPRGHDRRRTHSRIREEEAIAAAGGKAHFCRFTKRWRVLHLSFALSQMVLMLTGMSILFANTTWAPAIAQWLGGPKSMGVIHRIAATVMVLIFLTHLIVVLRALITNWRNFQIFGPDSLVPRWQDAKDIQLMFQWFLRKGPRPLIDRWAYWEKFDYWAAFWGMFIIGGSGLILALPTLSAQYVPGWAFNVASLVHSLEAFLATVFLFTVHFFNNHFRPDKLPPPDIVMFTGTQSLDEFRREHGAQYQRLLDDGTLSQFLVEAPSPALTFGSKVLGLVLISFGLILLMLVVNGFYLRVFA